MSALKKILLSACLVCLLTPVTLFAQQWNREHRIGTTDAHYQFSYNETPESLVQLDVPLYGGTPTYQWEQSLYADTLFSAISGATSSGYTFPGALSQTMFYRRKTTDPVTSTFIYSNVVRIEIVSVNWENINYAREHQVRIPGITDWKTIDTMSIGPKLQVTTYGDGIGRTLQKISRETAIPASGTLWNDQVQFTSYDKYGRSAVQFLPYVTSNQPGKFKTTPQADEAQYYTDKYGETDAYAQTAFDRSPLNRPVVMKKPGTAWAAASGDAIGYEFNTAADSVWKFHIGNAAADLPVEDGLYTPGELFKTIGTDVNGKKVVEYTDKSGRLILKKIQLDDSPAGAYKGWICTYSVFDDFGLLRFRMQPEAVNFLAANNWWFGATNGATVADEFCFYYVYDDKARVVEKKAPGAKPLRMLYDARNRLVMTQDGNQRAKSTPEWAVNIYDELDRTVITTLYKTSAAISQLKTDIAGATGGTLSVTHTATPAIDLEVSLRDPLVGVYSATNSVTILPGFESEDDGAFVVEVDPDATGEVTTSLVAFSGNPISSSDMANPSVTTILKYLFYDNYKFAGARSFSSSFTLGYSSSGELIPAIASSKRTLGMPTGVSTRVLGTNTFLSGTSFYDDKGRPIQQHEENLKKGTDVVTSQYMFDGTVLSVYNLHATSGTGYSAFGTITKNIIDKLGRFIETQQKHGNNDLKSIASYAFDDMGMLKTKRLAPGYTGSGKSELESLTYSNNIQGQITGVNKDFAKKAGGYSKWDHYFGYYLGFDNSDGVFGQAQLNGQVAGALWNTQGDDAQRKYEFTYDNAGRLTRADFKQKETTGDSWSNSKLDFTVSGAGGKIGYDLNGNLQSMLHKGVIAGGSIVNVDDLQYSYQSFSTKLKSVTDNGTAGSANGGFGDFKDGSNGSADDYVWDDNGNLIVDLNKSISAVSGSPGGIRYNHLDKPEEIVIAGKGTITIVYDADGNKLQRTWTPTSGTPRTTTYINAYVYEGNALQYITMPEGRIRVMLPVAENNGYESVSINGDIDLPGGKKATYDYFIRDYQENVRMVLTQESHRSMATATMETARSAVEEPVFGQVTNNEVALTRWPVSSIPGYPGSGWNNANIGASVSKLSKSGYKIGPNSLLKVMAGDTLNASAQYFYKNAATNSSGESALTEVVSALLQAITGNGAVNSVTKGATTNIGTQLGADVPLNSVVAPHENTPDDVPKAYISVLFFDERFNFIGDGSSQSVRVTTANASDEIVVLGPNIKAPKNGYAYIYVSNESDEPVYFDNFKVSHKRAQIAEENHYYAFGLKIAGISSKKLPDTREGSIDNKYLYNDKELFDDGDLNWYDYGFRNYDPQIGRFTQLDPLTDDYPPLTPYQYASNDPITNIDLDGLEGIPALGSEASGFIKGGFNKLNEVVIKNSPRALKPGLSTVTLAINAINIASNVVAKQLENKSLNQGLGNENVSDDLMSRVIGFAESNQGGMNYTDLAMLTEMTKNYYQGLNLMAWWEKADFLKLNRAVLQRRDLPAEEKILEVQAAIDDSQNWFNTLIHASANTALFISGSALFPNVGSGPRIPFQSGTQQQIVNARTVLKLESSITQVMGNSYRAVGEVTVPIKFTGLLNSLNATSRGNWVKVYEAGLQNGQKIETHYFRNNTTGQVFDVKTKYLYWHQKAFKNLSQ